jgi:hypothetical protein
VLLWLSSSHNITSTNHSIKQHIYITRQSSITTHRFDFIKSQHIKHHQPNQTTTTINATPNSQPITTTTQSKMPATPKSYLPAFAAFMAFGISYTTIVASKEGAAVDGARTRWQGQHASARRVLSGGMTMEELEVMTGK